MIEVAIGRSCQLESAEANVVQSLVVNAEGLICIFDKLVDREGSIVWLQNNSEKRMRRERERGYNLLYLYNGV